MKYVLLCVMSLFFWSNHEYAEARTQPTPLKTCVDRPTVETSQGPICGTHCPDGPVEICGPKVDAVKTRKYRAFCGIPFAKPPIGELRFKSPVPGDPWCDYRDGSWMPPLCPQFSFEDFLQGKENVSVIGQEDCLFLNVYVPEIIVPEIGFPVMVFIHGGGFDAGGIQHYYADKLMTRDVILVTIPYRLGILGFLSTGDEVAPGNLALKDQELSLHWVQDNIARFGGDPSKVTIFGESAGGISAHMHMINPQAKGLFSRVILQSGWALYEHYKTMDHRENAFQVATRLGCNIQNKELTFPPEQVQEDASQVSQLSSSGSELPSSSLSSGDGYNSEELLKCLQELPASSFVNIAATFTEWVNVPHAFSPRIGEATLPGAPSQLFRDGKYNMVDVMTGTNKHDGGFITKSYFMDPNAYPDLARNFSNIGHYPFLLRKNENDVAKQVFQYYLGGIREVTEDDADAITEMFGDYFFGFIHDYCIELHSRDALYGKNIYAYELKHKGDDGLISLMAPHIGKDYINHGDDVLYLFKFSPKVSMDTNKPENKKLESIMLDLWTNFATHGNPTPDRSLGFTWEPVSPKSTDHLVLKPEPYMEADTRCQQRKFFSSLNISMNRDLFPDRVGAGPKWKPWKIQDFKDC